MRVNTKDFASKIKELLVMKNDDGSYHLFGQYRIFEHNGTYELTHEIDNYYDKKHFSSLKTAVTYCVFEQHKKQKDLIRIIELDSLVSSLDVAIAQHKKLAAKAKTMEDTSIFLAKLYEEKLKKQRAVRELTDYVLMSKSWQQKRYRENQV